MIEYISAEKLFPAFSKLAGTLAEPAKNKVAKIKDNLKVKLRIGFESYVKNQIHRYSDVKTIINSSIPIKFENLYVNLNLSPPRSHQVFRDEDFLQISNTQNKILFLATAGSGKSMLMRYLHFLFLREQTDKLSIFIELRELNEDPSLSLERFLAQHISEYIENFSVPQLKYALENEILILFFDGYDEIDYDQQPKRAREINKIADRYKGTKIFVSSRPDQSIKSWRQFYNYEVNNFKKQQVCLLIAKVPYDLSVKESFLEKIQNGLYESHQEFLTNPLLTLIMLITIDQFAEIPGKIHLFYEYAFNALFSRHDASKNGYHRKRHSSIALDDYKRLFSYFCAITYFKQQIRIPEATALETLSKSINASQISAVKTEVLEDLISCTCVLIRDGVEISFSHRSFQEYFVAYFLTKVKLDELEKLAPKLSKRSRFDNVMRMISQMNEEKFEEVWALPQLEILLKRVSGVRADENPVKFLRLMFGAASASIDPIEEKVIVNLGEYLGISDPADDGRVSLYSSCGIFPKIHALLSDYENYDTILTKKILAGDILVCDERFHKLRTNGFSKTSEYIEFKITDTDDWWVRDSSSGRFVAAEQKVLENTVLEMRARVESRKAGFIDILDSL